jgi:uncharacterized damage-inducible protein DinB
LTNHQTPANPTRIIQLQSLAAAPARVAGAIEQLPPEAETWRPAAGEWTVRETVSHLAAADPLFLGRLELILAEDRPFLPYFGPTRARPDNDCPLAESLPRFAHERERLLIFLADLPPDAWERPAVHETMGDTTLGLQVQNLINHDLEHLGQLHKAQLAWNERSDV